VAQQILDLVGYTEDTDLCSLTLLEPSCGRGAFLLLAVDRLLAVRRRDGRDFAALVDCIVAYELQDASAAAARGAVNARLTADGCDEDRANKLADAWVRNANFLSVGDVPSVDVVVGNPPYIRIEDIPISQQLEYRQRFPTMAGRADIFVGFFEHSLAALKPGGRHSFICADRWMHNSYGSRLREFVASRFAVDLVWTMHDVDAFESAVSAYPAITLLRNGSQGKVTVADTTAEFSAKSAGELAAWHGAGRSTAKKGAGYAAHRLPHWFSGNEMWPSGDPKRLALIEFLNDRFLPLHSYDSRTGAGTRVGIGVATGADGVFVTEDATVVEPERMLPLSMVKDLSTGEFHWSGHYLVNPWNSNGSLVKLDDYPRLAEYLSSREEALCGRHVAQKNSATWYRTIDKVTASLTARPKLLLQDMRTTIHPVLESGGFYPHHNLYYVVSDEWDMEVLGGLLFSRVCQAFIEAYCVRMRGGTLRFQAQYLKLIRVPEPANVTDEQAEALRAAFRARDQLAATRAAIGAYGLQDQADYLLGDTI
jgi:hypothetical protein